MTEPKFILLRELPNGEMKACGVLPLTREEAIQQSRELLEGHLVPPGTEFFLQELAPVSLKVGAS